MTMVQETPHVEKIRYLRLNQVFDRALKQSLVKFQDWDIFSSSFPTYSKTKDGTTHLVNAQKQVSDFFTGLSHKEFEALLADRQVKEKLDELDELIGEANVRLEHKKNSQNNDDAEDLMDVPISELSPQDLLDCSLYTERQNAIDLLDERLTKIKNANHDLMDEIMLLENEIKDDLQETNDIYSNFFGERILESPDKDLQEALHDMLVQQSEYQE